jgi:hypothetical protein
MLDKVIIALIISFIIPLIFYLISGIFINKKISSSFTSGIRMKKEKELYQTNLLPSALFFLLLELLIFVILISNQAAIFFIILLIVSLLVII